MKIGEIIPADREITLNEGKNTVKILVANKGDRPVQVGSHYHFFEVNKCLSFEREAAYGYHLDIPSGTSVRFEPGEKAVYVRIPSLYFHLDSSVTKVAHPSGQSEIIGSIFRLITKSYHLHISGKIKMFSYFIPHRLSPLPLPDFSLLFKKVIS